MKPLSNRAYIRLIALFAFLSVTLGIYSIVATKRANRLQITVDSHNQRAINELCESIDSITVDLQKCLYAGTKDKLREQGNILCREATVAKENLSSLTDENTGTREIYKFLSQVGNYTVALSQGEGSSLSKKDTENLRALYEYSAALNTALTDILSGYSDGTVSFSSSSSTLTPENAELPDDFYSRMKDTEQTVTDYPTLLYDGPFSDTQGEKKSVFLESLGEITRDEAKKKAAELLGTNAAALREEKDITGNIELFCFSLEGNYISITKKGGYVYSLTSDTTAGEATVSPREAIERGNKYLTKLGYNNMTDSYYSVYDGICTVNYAYKQNGVTCYSDLIKVSITLDKGEAVALDASAFLSNHTERSFPDDIISASKAQRVISDNLKVISCKKAMIPLDTGRESLCYEFLCRDSDGQEVLVYVDCQSGKEQEIMLLLYQDDGILTR